MDEASWRGRSRIGFCRNDRAGERELGWRIVDCFMDVGIY